MPALHFSTQRIFNDRPTPLLLASVLYAASTQHALPEYAQLSPVYRNASARAIAELAIPAEEPRMVYSDVQALHNALGIIITGLLSEAWLDTTGLWISMAYQLVVTGATGCDGPRAGEWRGLYEGLRVSQRTPDMLIRRLWILNTHHYGWLVQYYHSPLLYPLWNSHYQKSDSVHHSLNTHGPISLLSCMLVCRTSREGDFRPSWILFWGRNQRLEDRLNRRQKMRG
jgi:hypothetical protein